MDRARELLAELADRWDDAYWWADHQLLQAAIAALIVGAIGLSFKWAELRMAQAMGAAGEAVSS